MSQNTLNDGHSISHTKWNCKYHVVFAPKYRRKVFYEEKRLEVGAMLRQLCQWKGVNIIEAEVCVDHVHMLLEIPPHPPGYEYHSLESKSPWNPRTTALLYHQMPTICRPQTKKRPFWGVKWPKKPKLRPTGMVKGFLFTCSKRCTPRPYMNKIVVKTKKKN